MIGVIKGTGSCVPGKVVTNDDIAGAGGDQRRVDSGTDRN